LVRTLDRASVVLRATMAICLLAITVTALLPGSHTGHASVATTSEDRVDQPRRQPPPLVVPGPRAAPAPVHLPGIGARGANVRSGEGRGANLSEGDTRHMPGWP
jgi:hypothetical protein